MMSEKNQDIIRGADLDGGVSDDSAMANGSTPADPEAPSAQVSSQRQSLSDLFTIVS